MIPGKSIFFMMLTAWNESMTYFSQYNLKEKDYKILFIIDPVYLVVCNDFGINFIDFLKDTFRNTQIDYIPNFLHDDYIRIIVEPKNDT